MRRSFLRSEDGSVTIMMLFLLPVMILIGGLATDISLINAQKRYVQSQADLAARSAVRLLPDVAAARRTAQQVVSANDVYGDVTLAREDVLFGTYVDGHFVAAADQDAPASASALRVNVPSPFNPLLLSSFIGSEDFTIERSAIAQTRGMIVFALRNKLLSVDTSQSILDPLLDRLLGLNLSLAAVGYAGLANTVVMFEDLLGLLDLGVAADALTFQEILGLDLSTSAFIDGLGSIGALPAGISSTSATPLKLGSLLSLSPEMLSAQVGHFIPDLGVNVFDLVMAAVSVNGGTTGTSLVQIPAAIQLGPVLGVKAAVELIAPGVIAMGYVDDDPPPTATLSQVALDLSADLLSLISLDLRVSGGDATAVVTSLNCAASDAGDTLATFDVSTATLTLDLQLGLLQLINGSTATGSSAVPILGGTQAVAVSLGELGQPVLIDNPIELSSVTSALSGILGGLQGTTQTGVNQCGLLGLGCLLGALTSVLNQLTALLNDLSPINTLVEGLFDALGIKLGQAELVVSDYSCSGRLVR